MDTSQNFHTNNFIMNDTSLGTNKTLDLEAFQNVIVSSNSGSPGFVAWIQQKLQNLLFSDETLWFGKQNLILVGTSVICATILAILLEHFRKKKPTAPTYEILLATVVAPHSTPEDVAVNCTFGALSVGMKTNMNNPEILDMWKKSGSEKKVLAVDDEKILEKLKELAEEKDIVNVLIRDVPISSHTSTTLALGPALPQDLVVFASFGRIIGQSKVT